MVAIFEIVFLIVCVVLGLWWFSRTNVYRGHRRSPNDQGQFVDQRGRYGQLGTRDEGPKRRPPRAP
jgi:hypothetical protein